MFAKVNALGKDLVAGHAQAGRERTEELVMKNQDFTTTISVDRLPRKLSKRSPMSLRGRQERSRVAPACLALGICAS